MRKKYFIKTWDANKEDYTPQKGVRVGPYSLFGLRKALRKLRDMGYDGTRSDPSTIVEDEEAYLFETAKR